MCLYVKIFGTYMEILGEKSVYRCSCRLTAADRRAGDASSHRLRGHHDYDWGKGEGDTGWRRQVNGDLDFLVSYLLYCWHFYQEHLFLCSKQKTQAWDSPRSVLQATSDCLCTTWSQAMHLSLLVSVSILWPRSWCCPVTKSWLKGTTSIFSPTPPGVVSLLRGIPVWAAVSRGFLDCEPPNTSPPWLIP